MTNDEYLTKSFETLAADNAEADSKIVPWQASLTTGDHFCYLSKKLGVVVWGKVLEEQTNPTMFGWRYCQCFSVCFPEGKDGYVHVSVIHKKVDPAIFERARQAEWPHDEPSIVKFSVELAAARNAN